MDSLVYSEAIYGGWTGKKGERCPEKNGRWVKIVTNI
jgi:hypothetical protein